MSRIISLTKVMLKSSTDLATSMGLPNKKNKKTTKVFTYILLSFLFLYLAVLVGFASYYVVGFFNDLGQPGISIQLMFTAMSVFLLFTTMILTPTIFYFAKDVERYLVMPLKPWEIITAKMLTNLVSMYSITAMIGIPFGVIYFIRVQPGFLFIPMYIIGQLLLPLLPLTIAFVFTVVLFTLIPFFNNKDLFTYISTGVMIVVSMGIGMFSSLSAMKDGANLQLLLASLQSGNNSVVQLFNLFFPSADWLARGAVYNDVFALLIGTAISIGAPIIGILLTQKIYFKGVLGSGGSNAKKRKISHSETYSRSTSRSQLAAIMHYDLTNILRTPMFMMNYFAMVILMPAMILVPIFAGGSFSALMGGIPVITDFLNNLPFGETLVWVLGIGFLLGFTFSSMTTMTSTALSREGKTMLAFRTMPVDLKVIVNAKIMLGTISMAVIPVLICIGLVLLLRVNLIYALAGAVMAFLGSLCDNIISMISDVFAPKLDWDEEQQAVKQNFMSIVPMFIIFGLIGFIIFLIVKLGPLTGFPIAIVLMLLLSGICYYFILRLSGQHLEQKIENI